MQYDWKTLLELSPFDLENKLINEWFINMYKWEYKWYDWTTFTVDKNYVLKTDYYYVITIIHKTDYTTISKNKTHLDEEYTLRFKKYWGSHDDLSLEKYDRTIKIKH